MRSNCSRPAVGYDQGIQVESLVDDGLALLVQGWPVGRHIQNKGGFFLPLPASVGRRARSSPAIRWTRPVQGTGKEVVLGNLSLFQSKAGSSGTSWFGRPPGRSAAGPGLVAAAVNFAKFGRFG